MKSIKIKVVDTDYVVRAKTDLSLDERSDSLLHLLKHLNEGFIPGETAYLEIEGFEKSPITLEVSNLGESGRLF
jgi:hypothetical protein